MPSPRPSPTGRGRKTSPLPREAAETRVLFYGERGKDESPSTGGGGKSSLLPWGERKDEPPSIGREKDEPSSMGRAERQASSMGERKTSPLS
ncbi:MAG TPA: hypothetical protein DIU03_16250 [Leclercia adecarboxylata]|nr:hypothetical protein [Leclercia adecarboxylata]